MSIELIGKIEGIVFSNKQTGYYIIKVKSDNQKIISVSGSFPGLTLNVGLKVKLFGDWTEHPKFGKQFSATSCSVTAEPGRNGIVTYLQSHVPSIGPITAFRLYDALGDSLIEALEKDHQKILDLPFLTKIQSAEIIKEWSTASENRTAAIFLSDLGLNSSQIKSVYTKFGTKTKEKVRENPYCLYECQGVGFLTSDVAAQRLGVGCDDMRRVRSFLLYCINELCSSEGHMYCTSSQIREHVKKIFKQNSVIPFSHGEYVADSQFYEALNDLQQSNHIVSIDDRVYPSISWHHESVAANCLAEIAAQEPRDFGDMDSFLSDFESARKVELSEEQRQAFFMLKKSRVCVVSGYPGTGKTLLISAMVYLMEQNNLHYVLMSPTGIAAKRLSQVTGKPASTIHRALGYKRDGSWEFNSSNKFFSDVVLVDECSMVDGSTFYHLISALPETTTLILVGDPAQLPSVGAGYVLNNLINCPSIEHVALTRIYRQEGQSAIVRVAHAMLQGKPIDTLFNKSSEFVFLSYPKEQVMDEICKFSSMIKQKCESSGLSFQVIAPMYNGDLGVNNLNKKLREVLNTEYQSGKASKLSRIGSRPSNNDAEFYEGDRIMVIKNDYDRMTFNGEVGKILRISPKNDEVEVKIFDWFDHESPVPRYVDKIFSYKMDEARHVLRVAYACTAHRCVSPNTLVETPDGLRRISDISGTGEISTPSGHSGYLNKVENLNSQMLRITTTDGYIIETTKDHGMEVWTQENGYIRRPASSLALGDILPLKLGAEWTDQPEIQLPVIEIGHRNETRVTVPRVLSEDAAEFFGLMVADGTIHHSGFRLIKSSKKVIDRFESLCISLFPEVKVRRFDCHGTEAIEVNSTCLSRWLLSIGGLGPKQKGIPDSILRSSLRVQSKFLRGFFEDGTVNIDRSNDKADHIELVTFEEPIFRDIKIMLLRFGIISGFGVRRHTLSDGTEKDYKVIYIYGQNVHKFDTLIGFISEEKSNRAKLPVGRDRNYSIPVTKAEILSVRNINGGPKFCNLSDKNVFTRNKMSRHQLASFLSRVVVKNDTYFVLENRLKQHHSKIQKIEEFIGPSTCVEVPDGNKFIQNVFQAQNPFWK